jgi:hypothetical protein
LQVEGEQVHGATITAADPVEPLILRQSWSFDHVHLVNLSGLCLGMPFDDFSDKVRAGLFACRWDPQQAWMLAPTGEIRHESERCLDIYSGFTDDGTFVQTYGCHGGDNQKFSLQAGRLEYSGKCVGPSGDDPLKKHPPVLELQTCRDPADLQQREQLFYVEGPIEGFGCLAVSDESAGLRLAKCDGGEKQRWRWFF